MQDNSFGVLLKLAVAAWTAFCGWFWGTGCFESAKRLEGDETALGFSVIMQSALWGVTWFLPTIGAYLLYRIFGRSKEKVTSPSTTKPRPIVRDNVAGKYQCPWCFGEIDPRAEVCPHCRKPTTPTN